MIVVHFLHSAIRDALCIDNGNLEYEGVLGIWFGLHFNDTAKQWMWLDGSFATTADIHWMPLQPNTSGFGQCGWFLPMRNNTANDLLTNDVSCRLARYSICEYKC